ncbi:ATP-binding protein [Micromonospora thermarum]|uniref:AAA family ATPase n=1 Tax=Micromonospora thermarum TaxID=2720024 RepID=A0ABX0Z294_9ACTN|nr:AAA family ATPase [Micromonospora thermarum]NJP31931.1 AAA family ATPase [Micromonospora thermarum]
MSLQRPDLWVGREAEVSLLCAAAQRLRGGSGTAVWIEGEAGIGKSALVAAVAASAREDGCEVLSATADQLAHPLPLRVMFDCLAVDPSSADPRRAGIADFVRAGRPELFLGGDTASAAAEMLIGLIDELCTAAPTLLVLDDLHWADDTSLALCQRLVPAATQMPLLLILSSRPVARRPQLEQLRSVVRSVGATTVPLGPLTGAQVSGLVSGIVGARPGPALTRLAEQANGNPLYVRELIDVLVRERLLEIGDRAELRDPTSGAVPTSLAAALGTRLSFVPAATMDVLRIAALFGGEFAVTEVAAVLGRPAIEFATDLQEAVTAGIIVEAGERMTFRHPLVRQALYDGMPAALRAALHRDAARALARSGTGTLRVAQQLLAAGVSGDRWARGWLLEATPALAARAPRIAAELLRRELEHDLPDDSDRAGLTASLARVLLGVGEHEEAARCARQALVATDRGPTHWILARALLAGGRNEDAEATLRQSLNEPGMSDTWRARLLASLAMILRANSGALDTADDTAREALRVARSAGDAFATAYALLDLWTNHSVRRQHLSALECVDRALEILRLAPEYADLRTFSVHGRIFTLQNLSRWPEAEATLREARQLAHRTGQTDEGLPDVTAAVLMYWLGRWDDALAELGDAEWSPTAMTYQGLRERGPALLRHGVAALIALRRYERGKAAAYVRAGLNLPVSTVADRENLDFLRAAQAVDAEQQGDPRRALELLTPVLERGPGEMTLTHQWLPDVVRLALTVDDRTTALVALRVSGAEADAEQQPARAAAAHHRCRGLYDGDAESLRTAVSHYRESGTTVELAGSLEDLAVVLARRDDPEARGALHEAAETYRELGAVWDVRRAEARLRELGVRRGAHGRRGPRATHGWEALTPTELKVALLVAEGRSTPHIAQSLFLTRRTAQTHISRILTKLGMRSRVEIAHAAFLRYPERIRADR